MNSTLVALAAGAVRGGTCLTRSGDVQCYLGIPFAQPPERFAPPVAVQPWSGVRRADGFGPAAPQNPDPFAVSSGYERPPISEQDCLNLNVWTPRNDGERRPVMVWIHGGAYQMGSNSAWNADGAELAAAHDVVVVSINYRLGLLAFLQLGHLLGEEYRSSGNVALLDQVLALRWVRDNIAQFGGDPDNVTVFGHSAGAAAVGTLLGMPASEGLFHRAILQSGTAERTRTLADSQAMTAGVLRAAGLDERRADELLTLPIERLLEVQQRVVSESSIGAVGLALPFQPVVDGYLIPRPPLQAIAEGTNSAVDLLVGTNLNEASFSTEFGPPPSVDPRTDRDKLELLAAEDFPAETEVFDRYRAALGEVLGAEVSDKRVLESYLSDRMYRQPTNRLLDARAGSRGRNFAYLFTVPSPMMGGRLGAPHASEALFVFRQLHRPEAEPLAGDNPPQQVSDRMSEAWTHFARDGAPEAAGLPAWPAYSPAHRSTMVLGLESEVNDDPRGALRKFWQGQP